MKHFKLAIGALGLLAAMPVASAQNYTKANCTDIAGMEEPVLYASVESFPAESPSPEEAVQLDVQFISELEGLTTEEGEKPKNEAWNSEYITVEAVADLSMLSTEVMARNRPEELYDPAACDHESDAFTHRKQYHCYYSIKK